jgi:hypothetical protein
MLDALSVKKFTISIEAADILFKGTPAASFTLFSGAIEVSECYVNCWS